MVGATSQVEGSRDGGCSGNHATGFVSELSQVLEQDIPAERHSGDCNRCTMTLGCYAAYSEGQIVGLSGVIESACAIRLAAARAPDQQIRAPSTSLHLRQEATGIVRARRSLQSVEQKDMGGIQGCAGRRVKPVYFKEIVVRCVPALDTRGHWRRSANDLSPECLRVRTRHPPGRSIMNGTVAHGC